MKDNIIKIFHTGDFHLDSPFSGLDVKQSDMRRAELRNSFSAALMRAASGGCELILIAGDLFDCGYVTAETVKKTFLAIEKCALPVVIAPGNHDPYEKNGVYDRSDKPKNLFVFKSSELSRLDFDDIGVSVHGYAFTSDRIDDPPVTAEKISLHPTNANILLAHGDIYSPISKYAPISPLAIEASGFDYVALGHIHKAEAPVRMGASLVAYCGFPEGRGFDELGFGGAIELTVDRSANTVSAERVTLSSRRYMIETVDVTGACSSLDLISAIERFVGESGFGRETSLRVVLTGAVSPELSFELRTDAEALGLAMLEIEDNTSPVYDAGLLENDISLRGALYRQLLPALRSSDRRERAVASEALRVGLAALDGKQIL